jgi:hypothetical protein
MDASAFGDNPRLRASDADRDQAAAVINGAMAEGRLTAEEHSDRLDAVYAAKTHADIVPLLDDLPGREVAAAPARAGAPARPAAKPDTIVAVLSGAARTGSWAAPPAMHVIAILGGVELDFREAVLPGREVTISAVCVLGGLQITVPPEMRVVDSGIAIMGGWEIPANSDEAAAPDAPVLRLSGAAVMGGVEVRRRPRAGPGRRGITR